MRGKTEMWSMLKEYFEIAINFRDEKEAEFSCQGKLGDCRVKEREFGDNTEEILQVLMKKM